MWLRGTYMFLPLMLVNNVDYTELFAEVAVLINSASSYVYPTNNNQYFTSNTGRLWPIDYGIYDFIIIGGGAAGGVLANRLTEETFSVLVLEAGGADPDVAAILGLNAYFYTSEFNWGYNTTVQRKSCLGSINRQCYFPRGRALGGTSIINGGFYVRGNQRDYDIWEEMGNHGWSYAHVLPYFKKSEHAQSIPDIDSDYHGFDGPQSVNVVEDTPGLTSALLEGFNELGQPTLDYNGASQIGISRMQSYLDFNTRTSTAYAYIRPISDRQNLHISLKSYVTKINIVSKTAQGVEFVKNGKRYVATAKKEVILSAGCINSPQVLMLSGIGPARELKRNGIPVIQDLPVGKNLVDHIVFVGLVYRTQQTYYNVTLDEGLALWAQAKRPLTPALAAQTVGFWNFDGSTTAQPEVEILTIGPPSVNGSLASSMGLNQRYVQIFQQLNPLSDLLVVPIILHTRSAGEVTLRSRDPREFPLINTNYFSDPEEIDLENMYKGIQTILQLADTEGFRKLGAELIIIPVPECDGYYEYRSRDWWYCAIRFLSTTFYHPVGTTRMGIDPENSVVSPDLKVHGIKKLRVVDAGVIPAHISGHTNAATVMIAEKIADSIKADYYS